MRVVVVTGAGRGFCAGADAGRSTATPRRARYDSGVREPLAEPGYGVRPEFDHAFAFHFGMAEPVIAAVNGPAAGVGLVLACFADLRFAAAGAKLTTSAPRLGLPAEYGLSWVLPRARRRRPRRRPAAVQPGRPGRGGRGDGPGQPGPRRPTSCCRHTYDYARALATEVSPASLRATKRQLYADLHGDVGTAVERSERAARGDGRRAPTSPRASRPWTEKRPPDFTDPG